MPHQFGQRFFPQAHSRVRTFLRGLRIGGFRATGAQPRMPIAPAPGAPIVPIAAPAPVTAPIAVGGGATFGGAVGVTPVFAGGSHLDPITGNSSMAPSAQVAMQVAPGHFSPSGLVMISDTEAIREAREFRVKIKGVLG